MKIGRIAVLAAIVLAGALGMISQALAETAGAARTASQESARAKNKHPFPPSRRSGGLSEGGGGGIGLVARRGRIRLGVVRIGCSRFDVAQVVDETEG